MNLRKIIAETAIAGALGLTALGLGPAAANAETPLPTEILSIPLPQDKCWCWDDWDRWGKWGHWGKWRHGGPGPYWWYRPAPPPWYGYPGY
jgi:hypothetical protein